MTTTPGNDPTDKTPLDSRQVWIAVTIALVAILAMKTFLDWGFIPAVIGGGSVGVIWFFINRAFNAGS